MQVVFRVGTLTAAHPSLLCSSMLNHITAFTKTCFSKFILTCTMLLRGSSISMFLIIYSNPSFDLIFLSKDIYFPWSLCFMWARLLRPSDSLICLCVCLNPSFISCWQSWAQSVWKSVYNEETIKGNKNALMKMYTCVFSCLLKRKFPKKTWIPCSF